MEVGICSQEHGFYRSGVMCGVWPRAAPKDGVLSSDGCLERGEGGTEAARRPQMSLCSHSLSSWLGTSEWFMRT